MPIPERPLALIAALAMATMATAHDHVHDANVRARMHTMSEMGVAAKVVGAILKGERTYDPAVAAAAFRAISTGAGDIERDFRTEAGDPMSKAKPAIWTSWADFSGKAKALRAAAHDADASTLSKLDQSLRQIGAACEACHRTYRD